LISSFQAVSSRSQVFAAFCTSSAETRSRLGSAERRASSRRGSACAPARPSSQYSLVASAFSSASIAGSLARTSSSAETGALLRSAAICETSTKKPSSFGGGASISAST
jgi:hypothetical protein